MRQLAFVGQGSLDTPRRLVQEGARLVLWSEERAAELERAGLPYRLLADYLGPGEREQIEQAAIAWTKNLGRRPLDGGQNLRELIAWNGHALWWWAELYLHHSTEAPRFVRLIETLNRVLEAEAPEEVHVLGLPDDEGLIAVRTCQAWRMLCFGPQPRTRPRSARAVSLRSRLNTLKTLGSALKATFLGRPPRPQGDQATLLFLSHAAFWRERRDPETDALVEYEHYFDRVLPAAAARPGLQPFVVAVGPEAAHRRRTALGRLTEWLRLSADRSQYVHLNRYTRLRVFRHTFAATRQARALWRRLRHTPGLAAALSHSGVGFGDLVADGFAATLLLQLPWAVRCYEEARALFEAVEPRALVLYAESSGLGRAALAAAADLGIPQLALQHGILYPGYFSYLHGPDEQACPRPTRTAVFGAAARDFLVREGGYAPDSLTLTGSPKFDDLLRAAAHWDRPALRRKLGLGEGQRLLVLASRFRAIRPTHQAVGSAFPALVNAIEARGDVVLLVKPHPAEGARAYLEVVRRAGAQRTRVLDPGADLIELLFACDALCTVESLSAVEALALGRPVLVLNLPTNLSELVASGAALGVAAGQDPGPAIERLLFDDPAREALRSARDRYVAHVAGGLDGQATARIVSLLESVAKSRASAP